MEVVKERYSDVGPTLAAERLSEVHGYSISREMLRKWMIEDGPGGDGRIVARTFIIRGTGAIASVSWFRSMGPTTGGLRSKGRNTLPPHEFPKQV